MTSQQRSGEPTMTQDELGYFRALLRQDLFTSVRLLFEQRRREEGLTQRELAKRIGINEALVSRRLAGETNITLDTMSDLARGLGGRIEFRVVPLEAIGKVATTSAATTDPWSAAIDWKVWAFSSPQPDKVGGFSKVTPRSFGNAKAHFSALFPTSPHSSATLDPWKAKVPEQDQTGPSTSAYN